MPRPDPRTGRQALHCAHCLEDLDEGVRRTWHCGHVDRERWLEDKPAVYLPLPYDGDVCPGYLMQSPCVREAELACAAFRQGELATYYPDQQAPVLKAAMVLHSAFNLYEAEQLAPRDEP